MPVVRKELPVVDPRRCSTCGDCLRICPTQCLVVVHQLPVVTTSAACIRCEACVIVCPTQAVSWAISRV